MARNYFRSFFGAAWGFVPPCARADYVGKPGLRAYDRVYVLFTYLEHGTISTMKRLLRKDANKKKKKAVVDNKQSFPSLSLDYDPRIHFITRSKSTREKGNVRVYELLDGGASSSSSYYCCCS